MSFHSSNNFGRDLRTPAAAFAPCWFPYPLLGGRPGGSACSARGLWTAKTGLITSEGCRSMNGLCASRVGKAPWCDWPKSTLEVEGIIDVSGNVSNNVLDPGVASNVSVLFSSFTFGVYGRVLCSIFSFFVFSCHTSCCCFRIVLRTIYLWARCNGWILPDLLPKLSHTDHKFCR